MTVGLETIALHIVLLMSVADGMRPTLGRAAFARLLSSAGKEQQPLFLRGRDVDLGDDEIKLLSSGENVTVVGPGRIRGSGHTLFTAGGNRQRLRLCNLQLMHCSSAARVDKREKGAAVWIRGKSSLRLENCVLSSEAGFCLWLVQRANADLDSCTIGPSGRSCVVVFGDAVLALRGSRIHGAPLHGICARGASRVSVVHSVVWDCTQRGIYVYHNASIHLDSSLVSECAQADSSAVQVEALRPEDQAHLTVTDCSFANNAGRGLSVAGNVICKVDGSVSIDSALSAVDQYEHRGAQDRHQEPGYRRSPSRGSNSAPAASADSGRRIIEPAQ